MLIEIIIVLFFDYVNLLMKLFDYLNKIFIYFLNLLNVLNHHFIVKVNKFNKFIDNLGRINLYEVYLYVFMYFYKHVNFMLMPSVYFKYHHDCLQIIYLLLVDICDDVGNFHIIFYLN